jgi:hypothetical protein
MTTALLLLPVVSILVWLYWYCLPVDESRSGRWRWIDTLLLLTLVGQAGIFVLLAMRAEYVNAGPIWSEIVAVTGAYGIIAIGLALGLIVRRKAASKK